MIPGNETHAGVGAPNRSTAVNLLRGNIVRDVSGLVPAEIDLSG